MTVVQCGDEFYLCRCSLDAGHAGSHVCPCEGSWEVRDDRREVVALPDVSVMIGPVQPKPVEQ